MDVKTKPSVRLQGGGRFLWVVTAPGLATYLGT